MALDSRHAAGEGDGRGGRHPAGSPSPDFFILGAPKCGTTALADYLARHPEVGMCARKETHFFASDLEDRITFKRGQRLPTDDEYLRLFDGLGEVRRRGEASGWYLYSPGAARRIEEFSPDADVIAMIRNPLTMLPSLHAQLVFLGLEPEEDLERALALDEERERNGTPPGFVPSSYRAAVRFGPQLRRYLEVFGPTRVHVVVYERFRDDTAGSYREVCRFLGVDAEQTPELAVVNPRKRVRSRAVRRLSRRPPEGLRRLAHAVTSQSARRRVGLALKRWNTKSIQRPPVPATVSEALRPLVSEQVRELGELGVDVRHWLD